MTIRVIIVTLTVLAFVAGCGGSKTNGGSSLPSQPAPQSQQQTPAGPVIDITISNGTVTPADAEFNAKVHQSITFRVTSDAADELHVHSVPDHEFEVEAKPNQTFQFSVDVPGQVEVELHKLDRTVATIRVQQ
jgi:hypothetical protein